MDKETILNELQPLQGTKKVIVENQSTGDIIEGILDTHKRYQKEYDKIYKYFIGSNLNETCNNIWQFLKDNVKYYVEPQKLQTLRSPAAILSKAADCKSYSLFANGILDAYRRNENKNFDVCYRFAGYTKPKRIEHVFSVCIDKKGNEIWTDAVLNGFNDRFTIPVYSRDKKINNMALVAIAGVPQNTNWRNQGVSYESVGKVPHIYYGTNNNQISGGVFGGTLLKVFKEMLPKIDVAFLYLTINTHLAPDLTYKFPNVGMSNDILRTYIGNIPSDKRFKSSQCFFELHSQMDSVISQENLMRLIFESLNNTLGMPVKEFWKKFFGNESSISGYKNIGLISEAKDIFNGVSDFFKNGGDKAIMQLLGVNLRFEPAVETFLPSLSDWKNTPYPKDKNLITLLSGSGSGSGSDSGSGSGKASNILPLALVALAAKFLLFK